MNMPKKVFKSPKLWVSLALTLLFSMVLFGCGSGGGNNGQQHLDWYDRNCPSFPKFYFLPDVPPKNQRPCYKYIDSVDEYYLNLWW